MRSKTNPKTTNPKKEEVNHEINYRIVIWMINLYGSPC